MNMKVIVKHVDPHGDIYDDIYEDVTEIATYYFSKEVVIRSTVGRWYVSLDISKVKKITIYNTKFQEE